MCDSVQGDFEMDALNINEFFSLQEVSSHIDFCLKWPRGQPEVQT